MFEDLIPEFQPYAQWIVGAAADAGLQPRVTSTRRSRGLQKKLYDRFLRGESKYPALPPGLSAHEFGYAFDMIVTPESALDDVGYTWVQAGGIWGPGDAIHFEFPGFVPPPESRQNAIADFQGVFHRLQTRRKFFPLRMRQIRVGGAGGNDQIVVADLNVFEADYLRR